MYGGGVPSETRSIKSTVLFCVFAESSGTIVSFHSCRASVRLTSPVGSTAACVVLPLVPGITGCVSAM